MHPRMPLAFLAARTHCWLMVNLSSTRTPRSLSTELLSSRSAPSLYECLQIIFIFYKKIRLPGFCHLRKWNNCGCYPILLMVGNSEGKEIHLNWTEIHHELEETVFKWHVSISYYKGTNFMLVKMKYFIAQSWAIYVRTSRRADETSNMPSTEKFDRTWQKLFSWKMFCWRMWIPQNQIFTWVFSIMKVQEGSKEISPAKNLSIPDW